MGDLVDASARQPGDVLARGDLDHDRAAPRAGGENPDRGRDGRPADAAGNVDATPASRTWTVDTTAPQTTIDSGPTGTVNTASAQFDFSSEAGASFECRIDAGTWEACTSPSPACW